MRDWIWLLLAILMLSTGYVLQKADVLERWFPENQDVVVQVLDCDLRQGGCEIENDGHKFVFAIEPNDIQILHPLMISLRYPENSEKLPEKVSVEFEGINMDMGYNRFSLEPSGQGLFAAKGMLPACTAETMYWRIHLLVKRGATVNDFQFRLVTENH